MNEVSAILPYMFACGLFFGFLVIGIKLLASSKESLLERFGQWYFTCTQRSLDQDTDISKSTIISLTRTFGGVCLTLSALGAWMLISRLIA